MNFSSNKAAGLTHCSTGQYAKQLAQQLSNACSARRNSRGSWLHAPEMAIHETSTKQFPVSPVNTGSHALKATTIRTYAKKKIASPSKILSRRRRRKRKAIAKRHALKGKGNKYSSGNVGSTKIYIDTFFYHDGTSMFLYKHLQAFVSITLAWLSLIFKSFLKCVNYSSKL